MKIDLKIQPTKKPPLRVLSEKQRSKIMRGWYIHCNTFYAGHGWQIIPPCPKCGEESRRATQGEVADEHWT